MTKMGMCEGRQPLATVLLLLFRRLHRHFSMNCWFSWANLGVCYPGRVRGCHPGLKVSGPLLGSMRRSRGTKPSTFLCFPTPVGERERRASRSGESIYRRKDIRSGFLQDTYDLPQSSDLTLDFFQDRTISHQTSNHGRLKQPLPLRSGHTESVEQARTVIPGLPTPS